MKAEPDSPEVPHTEPDIDESGVDRAQIRAMLARTPEERLRWVEGFVQSALEIRELNEKRPLR